MFKPADTHHFILIAQRLRLMASVARTGDRNADTLAGRSAR